MFFGTCGVLLSMFVMLWVLFDNAKTAATVVITAFATLALTSIGFIASHMAHRQSAPPRAPDVIDATPLVPHLPEPRWFQTGTRTLTRSTALDDKAHAIAQALRDAELPPTRNNIKLYGGDMNINGNEGASVIYARFVRWGWAEPVSQGEPGRWKDET